LLDHEWEKDDRKVATWYEENRKKILQQVDEMKKESTAADIASLLSSSPLVGLQGVQRALAMMPVEEREKALKLLSSA
ncbi:acetyl-coenzyme-A carboxylase, partial [Ascosphaera atra]